MEYRNKNKAIATEQQEQYAFAQWLRLKKIPFYHIPNGGYRTITEAKRFKKMGVSAGVPDICIPIASNNYHGLYIELKRRTNAVVTEAQNHWMKTLQANNYRAVICKGAEAAITETVEYLRVVDEQTKA